MQILHKGFDTITLAMKANIPHDLFEFLAAEKELAEAERAPALSAMAARILTFSHMAAEAMPSFSLGGLWTFGGPLRSPIAKTHGEPASR